MANYPEQTPPESNGTIAEVVINVPLRRHFDYRIPQHLDGRLQPGMRVVVPFGSRPRSGIVVALKERSDLPPERLKEVSQLPADAVLFSAEMLNFTRWLAEYYFCGWGDVLEAALPAGMTVRFKVTYALEAGQDSKVPHGLSASVNALMAGGAWDEAAWTKAGASPEDCRWLARQVRPGGAVRTRFEYSGTRAGPATQRWVRLGSEPPPPPRTRRNPLRESRQDKIMRLLRTGGELPVAGLRNHMSDPAPVLRKLAEAGAVEMFERRIDRRAHAELHPDPEPFLTLNSDQQAAYDRIEAALQAGAYHGFLLQGVTGSGKTEVYLHAVRTTLERGRSALVLVPEIALTVAIVERFRARFGDRVAVLHSGLAEGERFDEWSRIHDGRASIVIGARSALFAPLTGLGLVIVDEEHDSSYKQEETPRYHGRDAALMRAYQNGAVAVLGSATPSLEAVRNVSLDKLTRLLLPRRVSERPLPRVELIGLRATPRQPGSLMFSQQLVDSLRDTLLRKEQAILFLNRRGFAQLARCRGCEEPILCDNCSITLTYHQVAGQLRCHRCDFQRPLPAQCPECGAPEMEIVGMGTERIEEEIGIIFPDARVLRMDSDTLRAKGELERMLGAIRRREYDVIIGTQILSKGHDFPHITLVGAVLADISLNIPDFRAAERTFQILTQMAGRAGRGDRPGLVLIQTYNPDHYSLAHVVDHDAVSFSQEEMTIRQETGAPPFCSQALVWTTSPVDQRARALAVRTADALKSASAEGVMILGPAEAPVRKVNNRYRWMVLLRAPAMSPIRRLLGRVLDPPAFPVPAKDRITVDVDPYNLL